MLDHVASYFQHLSPMTYLVVFVGGIIASFTPCVYPLVPIIIGVIGGSQGKENKLRALGLSASYVSGMALTFSVLGMIAALTGRVFGEFQTSPIAYLIVGNAMILFGLVLLDVISLPVFFLSKLGAGKITKGRTWLSAFFMGAVSGFIAAPCTAAVLGALLTYVATTQNILAGFSLLFVFAWGLGTLLLLVGTGVGVVKAIPQSEQLMKIMQRILAFGMILLGEYFIFKAGGM